MPTQTVRLGELSGGAVVVWLDYNDANMGVTLIHADLTPGSTAEVGVYAADGSEIGRVELVEGANTYNPPGMSCQITPEGRVQLTAGRSWSITGSPGTP